MSDATSKTDAPSGSGAVSGRPPLWFWIVAGLAVLWNLAGVGSYLMEATMSADSVAAMSDAQRTLFMETPAWATGAFAIAVFAGLAGSIALAVKSRFATLTFAASLAGVAVQMFHAFVLADAVGVLGASAAVMPAAIALIAIALLWFSFIARGKGWLR